MCWYNSKILIKCDAEIIEEVLEQIHLKKAILARAFPGELGTNDPSEESAQELVKQISSF